MLQIERKQFKDAGVENLERLKHSQKNFYWFLFLLLFCMPLCNLSADFGAVFDVHIAKPSTCSGDGAVAFVFLQL